MRPRPVHIMKSTYHSTKIVEKQAKIIIMNALVYMPYNVHCEILNSFYRVSRLKVIYVESLEWNQKLLLYFNFQQKRPQCHWPSQPWDCKFQMVPWDFVKGRSAIHDVVKRFWQLWNYDAQILILKKKDIWLWNADWKSVFSNGYPMKDSI